MSYRIDNIPNRGRPPTVLLRRHWREGKRVRKETIANLTHHPDWLVEGIRALVKAGTYRAKDGEGLGVRRTFPHGHVARAIAYELFLLDTALRKRRQQPLRSERRGRQWKSSVNYSIR